MIPGILALLLGGLLKGATGAGAPVIAVPVLAMTHDVQLAIVVMMVPNLVSNIGQGWAFRRTMLRPRFVALFAGGGLLGAGVGTALLATVSPAILLLTVACAVYAYIGFRVWRANWVLTGAAALPLAGPVGFLAGVMQGAAGISAPISITFLNAMRLPRDVFIGTISIFFLAMTVMQIPALAAYGLLTWERLGLSALAVIPILAAMPVGAALARRISKAAFDRLTLVLLAVVATRLAWEALM